jgi:hypothetical protein
MFQTEKHGCTWSMFSALFSSLQNRRHYQGIKYEVFDTMVYPRARPELKTKSLRPDVVFKSTWITYLCLPCSAAILKYGVVFVMSSVTPASPLTQNQS